MKNRLALSIVALLSWPLAGSPDLDAAEAAEAAGRDAYGGSTAVRFEATGFFRAAEKDGAWWLVTPDGSAFISKGVNNVSFRADDAPALGHSPYERAVKAKHGSEAAWAEASVKRLRGWGFNTIGAWSSRSTWSQRVAYTVNLDLATRAGADWLRGSTGDFFSPEFEARIERACAETCGPRAKDPWLLGYFTDNELRWGADWRSRRGLLDEYLLLGADAPGAKAARELLRERHGSIEALSRSWGVEVVRWEDLGKDETVLAKAPREDQDAWVEKVAKRYFSLCRAAIRKADPNHLVLGCRFAGYAPDPVLRGLRDEVDVVSFNNYDQDAPAKALERIHAATKRPLMLTEFSFKAADSGLPNTRGAGSAVPTQEDRAASFARYVGGLLDLPFVVGFHWFEHADEPKEGRFDGENSNYGLVKIDDEPWEVLTRRTTEVNATLEERHAASGERPSGPRS